LLVSQSRFEREPRRSDSYSVIHCKEVRQRVRKV